jgi:hypothetical protein
LTVLDAVRKVVAKSAVSKVSTHVIGGDLSPCDGPSGAGEQYHANEGDGDIAEKVAGADRSDHGLLREGMPGKGQQGASRQRQAIARRRALFRRAVLRSRLFWSQSK